MKTATRERRKTRFLTTRQVAEMLHYHVNSVRRLSNQGMIKSCRIGSRGDRRYFRQDVLQFLAERQNGVCRNITDRRYQVEQVCIRRSSR